MLQSGLRRRLLGARRRALRLARRRRAARERNEARARQARRARGGGGGRGGGGLDASKLLGAALGARLLDDGLEAREQLVEAHAARAARGGGGRGRAQRDARDGCEEREGAFAREGVG